MRGGSGGLPQGLGAEEGSGGLCAAETRTGWAQTGCSSGGGGGTQLPQPRMPVLANMADPANQKKKKPLGQRGAAVAAAAAAAAAAVVTADAGAQPPTSPSTAQSPEVPRPHQTPPPTGPAPRTSCCASPPPLAQLLLRSLFCPPPRDVGACRGGGQDGAGRTGPETLGTRRAGWGRG